jgi:hypothetical protein
MQLHVGIVITLIIEILTPKVIHPNMRTPST